MYQSFVNAAFAMQQHDTTGAWEALAHAAEVMRAGAPASHVLTKLAGARLVEFSTRTGREVTTGARVRRP
jgi:hypothetical protein